jgi:hypothetical protein
MMTRLKKDLTTENKPGVQKFSNQLNLAFEDRQKD